MNKLKFLHFISVIVFFVAVIVPLSSAHNNSAKWNRERADYESSGLEAYPPKITSGPANGLTMHGERGVLDDGTIVTEEWVPYKPKNFHYIRISIIATGYGEVAFELKGYRRDYAIGHWTSEPIKKAVNEYYVYQIEEPNNVDVANIQPTTEPTTVNVSAYGKAYTRSVRVTTYGSKQEAKSVQASTSGVSVGVVTGTSSFWKWTAGITVPVPAEGHLHYTGEYSFTVNDYKLGYSANNTGFPAYGTYEAKVADINPIDYVDWMIKKPGGEWKLVERDEVNGGKSSSFSYSLDSTLGTYEVYVWIYFENDDSTTSYSHKFTVY